MVLRIFYFIVALVLFSLSFGAMPALARDFPLIDFFLRNPIPECPVFGGIAFDGSEILISCTSSNVITRVRPVNGTNLGSITVDGIPASEGIADMSWDARNGQLLVESATNTKKIYTVIVNKAEERGIATFLPDIQKVGESWLDLDTVYDYSLQCDSVTHNPSSVVWTIRPSIDHEIYSFLIPDLECPADLSRMPLILIPGIGGSELKVIEDTYWLDKDDGHGGKFSHIYPKDETVWLNEGKAGELGEDDYYDVLRMQHDGITSEANIELTGNLVNRVYQKTIDFFTANDYELNKDFFVFPYDWRKDISLTAELLDQKIDEIKARTGSLKVDIIAHSMGGLVARNYISKSNRSYKVRNLFTLGTPHLGSVKFLKALRYGDCLAIEIGPFCLSVAPSEMKDVIQNMISGFELAPSDVYFSYNLAAEDKNHHSPYRTESGPLSYHETKDLLRGLGHNTSLFSPSESLHNIDPRINNTHGVYVTIVAGSGHPTLGQIIEEKRTSLLGKQYIYKDILNINGDKTVPLLSASLNDPHKDLPFPLSGPAKVYYTNQEHSELISNGPALNLVENILLGNTNLPNGVSKKPYTLSKGWLTSVHSPVEIHIYDSSGNHTGPTADGDFEANIPGSSYDTLDDAKFIWLPDDGEYDIKFDATDEGSFDFKIREYEDDNVIEEFLYENIPLTNLTTGEAEFDTSSNTPPIIHLDEDGNGTIDQNIFTSSDQTAPKTTAEFSGIQGNNGWYKSNVVVNLLAEDEASGSGILKTEYSLDNGTTVNIYTAPFTINTEKINKLQFRSIDNAGNEENHQEVEIKIDKTAPEAKIFIDQDKQDLVVTGEDKNQTTVTRFDNTLTKSKIDAFYYIEDIAGNRLKLDIREKDSKNQDQFKIHSIQYNNGPIKKLENNYFSATYIDKKGKLYVREQNLKTNNQVRIRIQYDANKNKSTITFRERKGLRKEIKNGLILLQLFTSEGQLKTIY